MRTDTAELATRLRIIARVVAYEEIFEAADRLEQLAAEIARLRNQLGQQCQDPACTSM